jgi:hypothetical protein
MTKEEFLGLATEEWERLEALKSETSFYEYEKGFDLIWVELGQKVLEKSISDTSKDRRKKNKLRVDTGL